MSGRQKHLPLLYNPLLNAIFNNPHHAKAAIRSTINELSLSHNDYTILVPPGHILRNCTEPSGSKLEELCYDSDAFLKSHILKTSAPFSTTMAPVTKIQSIIYNTMNGRQVLVKNGMVFTGKGFKRSIKAEVLSTDYFITFCDYFPKGSKVMLLYISDSLFGHSGEESKELPPEPELRDRPRSHRSVTFEELLRNFPLLSKAMSDQFYVLFHHNNRKFERLRARTGVSLEEVRSLFMAMVEEAFSIVQKTVNAESAEGERISRLLHNITVQNMDVDLNNLVHEYVELNVYDKVWVQLVNQFEKTQHEEDPLMVLSSAVYNDLSCLSLNQLDLPVEEPWYLNVLHARVAAAIAQFSKLNDPSVTNRRQKIDLIRNTVDILTEGKDDSNANLVVDADTLIGLLIMVIVHSKVPNLEAHIYYIRHFGIDSIQSGDASSEKHSVGYLNYILSNIDAVIYHLSGKGSEGIPYDHFQEMSKASSQNYSLWYAIQKEDLTGLQRLLGDVDEQYSGKQLPKDHFLKSRNIHGESCFCFAIRSKNFELFKTLIDRTSEWFSVEDLIFDRNTTTDQTLMMVALVEENSDVSQYLLSVILADTTAEEQCLYYNLKDKSGRTLGHYLGYDITILEQVGPYVDWYTKDNNSHTPLFSLCRHYDHHDYRTLVQKAFACVFKKYPKPLALDEQIDKYGNTFLHVLARGIAETGILETDKALVDVNHLNEKLLSPSAVYIRYSRTENLALLMKNDLFNFFQEDQRNFYNLLDYYSFSAAKASNGSNKAFGEVERIVIDKYFEVNYSKHNDIQLGVLNARYDGSANDWIINTVMVKPGTEKPISTQYIAIDKLRQFTKLQKMAFPQGFGLDVNTFWINHPANKSTIPACSKYRSNRLLELLTMYFQAMNFHSDTSKSKFRGNFAMCCADSKTSTLEMMKDINKAQENAKVRNGEVKFSSQKIQEIEIFLDYSSSDLLGFHLEMSKLNQILTVTSMKQSDLRNVSDILLRQIKLGSTKHLDVREFRALDASYQKLQSYASWLELSVNELLQNCRKLKEKLQLWKEIYHGIKELNNELHRFEDQVKVTQNGVNEEAESESATRTISRRSTTSLDSVPSETQEAGSFFNFGIIDSKKSKYKKLLMTKSEEVKKVMNLNAEIKIDHELIAAEISQFLSFRSGFFSLGIKQFCKTHLLSLRNRNHELETLLWSIRRQ
ncbi:uncharacterized protein CXQ87_003690 [Candidozyma duobushaemuli]|uniref:VPS9 domain-containing protein n=1 Tax=Candidozyma duobushaemuli TaxID=1231522 RepID=A0A2V1ADR9_9ASCO|nr:uncharacterized protein CXQ87_003690 [[Candida] duobushaemulonis]PVH15835.1 hypothetical protein CXQ87_003690 [[Candida] duobushaemulonis]